jgi:fucose permease
MEPLKLLGVIVAIAFVGYALINIVFKVVEDTLSFLENNRMAMIILVALVICLWFGYHS